MQYQKLGLMTYSIIRAALLTYKNYFLKNKYFIALTTTPQAYQYLTFFKEYWPTAGKETPLEIVALMESFLLLEGINKYKIKEGVIINYELLDKIKDADSGYINNEKVLNYYNHINPQARNGAQLVCIAPFIFSNVSDVLKRLTIKFLKSQTYI